MASPLAWMVNDQSALCEPASIQQRPSTLSRLKTLFSLSPTDAEPTENVNAFGKLNKIYGSTFVKLLNNAVAQSYAEGEHIFRTNEDCSGDDAKFYWILDGAVEVKDQSAMEGEGAEGDRLSSGAFFGDLALIAKAPRRVRNIHATRDSIIMAIRKPDFDKALTDINSKLGTKKGDTKDARVLAFAEMVTPATTMRLKKGQAVFRQGETCDDINLYIVKRGSLKMLKSEGGKEPVEVKEVEEGECVGYVSLLLKDKSKGISYTVVCDSPSGCELAVIKGEDFQRLMGRSQMVANYMRGLNREFYSLHAQAKAQEAQIDSDF